MVKYLAGLVLIFSIFGSVHANIDAFDQKSHKLAKKAWAALEIRDFKGVFEYSNKVIELYSKKAFEQQKEYNAEVATKSPKTYWALNDVATCYFIQALSLKRQRKFDEAKKVSKLVSNNFPGAQCFDPRGWYWNVSNACKDMVFEIETKVDFGDYTSQTLVSKAWFSLNAQQYQKAVIYADKCILLYEKDALKQQNALSDFPKGEKEIFDQWALNDVGTAYFIKGSAYQSLNKKDEAINAHQYVLSSLPFAQCWDPKGWFWKVKDASKKELQLLVSQN